MKRNVYSSFCLFLLVFCVNSNTLQAFDYFSIPEIVQHPKEYLLSHPEDLKNQLDKMISGRCKHYIPNKKNECKNAGKFFINQLNISSVAIENENYIVSFAGELESISLNSTKSSEWKHLMKWLHAMAIDFPNLRIVATTRPVGYSRDSSIQGFEAFDIYHLCPLTRIQQDVYIDHWCNALANVELAPDDWRRLLLLAHTDKSRAFQEYARHYLATDGQTYWSDTHQLGVYLDNYHAEIDRATGAACRCSEMISELYVPPDRIADFLQAAQMTLRSLQGDVIYGTVRLIHKDEESFLAWARETFACVIFNLHDEHSPAGLEHAAACFRALIDLALDRGGSFYLTYHRFATREQLLRAYPQLPAFIAAKRRLDPAGVFDSEWWRWIAATAGTPARAETTQGRAASPKAMSA